MLKLKKNFFSDDQTPATAGQAPATADQTSATRSSSESDEDSRGIGTVIKLFLFTVCSVHSFRSGIGMIQDKQ